MNHHSVVAILAAGLLASGAAWAQQSSQSGIFRDQSASQSQIISKKDLNKNDIREIQSALNSAGYNAGNADGMWGAGTTKALRDFQRAKGLNASGQLDQDTLLALGFSRDQFAAAAQPTLNKSDVRQVQEALNKAGFKVRSVDGTWGRSTETALRDFQKAKGLQPTGKLDRESVLALGLSISDFAAGEFNRESGNEQRPLQQ